MMNTGFELLAPAGSFEILKAVIEAGADAVYVGGSQFGARAYANNFTEEELLEAIDYVHLRGKKLFLTVNTLFKNTEIHNQLYDYLLPYYERGLDAVIVQDFGAIEYIKTNFPNLPIHTSTQMTVTGVEGAKLMKNLGAERVVLARELSLEEMKRIREEADIELEAFIHGALCYSYSGQCLFSSILGGRSGNRGRCAQPCRLPYAVLDAQKKEYKKESFCLSLKDLCGIEYLQKLREAGVYSLKIEGRMKQASYAAGVVSFYRKYIDLEKSVTKEDMQHLYELGNRCGFTTTYFEKHNDKSMITFDKPSYEKTNEALHKEIERRFVGKKSQIPINGTLIIQKGQPLELYLHACECCAYVSLGEVQDAQKKPLEEKDVRKRINKTGETDFYFETLEIHMDSDVFVPNGMLNQLRRDALEQLRTALLVDYRREKTQNINTVSERRAEEKCKDIPLQFIASCETKEQMKELISSDMIQKIYIDVHAYDIELEIKELEMDIKKTHEVGKEIYLRLPAIFRGTTSDKFAKIISKFNNLDINGLVVRNYEELYFVQEYLPELPKVIDYNLYTFNDYAQQAFDEFEVIRDTIPLELNQKEIRNRYNTNSEMVIYGHYPLMVTAGCVHKNTKACDKVSQITYLKDRYRVLFPVKNYCKECYNIVYNSVPTLLLDEVDKLKANGIRHFRLDFTIESAAQVRNVLLLFQNKGQEIETTKGHYKRGVE